MLALFTNSNSDIAEMNSETIETKPTLPEQQADHFSISRVQAFFSHLAVSALIFSSFFLVLILLWYPAPYFSASGGWQGIKIVALVDIVLGPVLTFCIFDNKKPKKNLLFDLGVILIIQISALLWGIFTVYQQRPVALVFWEDRFFTAPARVFNEQAYDIANLTRFSQLQPALIYAETPDTLEAYEQLLATMKQGEIPPMYQPTMFKPFQEHLNEIFQANIKVNEILQQNNDMANQHAQILAEQAVNKQDIVYVKLESRYRNIILMLSKTGEQIGYLTAPYKNNS